MHMMFDVSWLFMKYVFMMSCMLNVTLHLCEVMLQVTSTSCCLYNV